MTQERESFLNVECSQYPISRGLKITGGLHDSQAKICTGDLVTRGTRQPSPHHFVTVLIPEPCHNPAWATSRRQYLQTGRIEIRLSYRKQGDELLIFLHTRVCCKVCTCSLKWCVFVHSADWVVYFYGSQVRGAPCSECMHRTAEGQYNHSTSNNCHLSQM